MLINILTSTLLSLKAHKLRVILTMIGIIIGISSVVTITALGEGLKKAELDMIGDSGINTIKIIYEGSEDGGGGYIGYQFSRLDMKRLRSLENVESVAADYGYGGFRTGEVIDGYLKFMGIEGFSSLVPSDGSAQSDLSFGRNFITKDMDKNRIIIPYELADQFAKDMDKSELIGKALELDGYMYEVIGIKPEIDWNAMRYDENWMYSSIPKKAFLAISKSKPINAIKLTPTQGVDRDALITDATETLASYHPELTGSFVEDHYMDDMRNQMEQTMNIAIWIFIGITAISLLVGGIGVMNIMYVSVSERKREIGIKRAIGAKPKVILLQFLFEAAFITLIGGIIGIFLGYGLSHLFAVFMPAEMGTFEAVLRPEMAAIAAGVSVAIGLFFGIVPAVGASKTDPIKAIYQ